MDTTQRPRIRELGMMPGELPTGPHNAITDVPGTRVGHETLHWGSPDDAECVRTGVSVIDPVDRDLYESPVVGAAHVLNGYGKSVGLPQLLELGQLETPIGLTNTLDVWTVADAIVGRVLDRHSEVRSINPVVGECNDGRLHDIRGRHVTADHVEQAFAAATDDLPEEGCVGAGVGTTGFGWKAGIGTASRRVDANTVGALVLTNTGRATDLRIDGLDITRFLEQSPDETSSDGSIMLIVGTDASLSARQLGRLAKRAPLGLARVGGIASHRSGDFVLAFGTGCDDHVNETDLTPLFRGVIESIEEAIYNSLTTAVSTTGVGNETVNAIPIEAIEAAVAERSA
ncbi:MAG: P1 family peptidase [Halobacteriales archaeon]